MMYYVPVQIELYMNAERREKQVKLDRAVDDIRRRFGYRSIQRCMMYQDRALASLDAKASHTVYPHAYFYDRGRG